MHSAVRDGGTGNCLKRSLTPLSAANRFIFFCMQVQPPECGFSDCKSSLDILTVLQVGDLGILCGMSWLCCKGNHQLNKKKKQSCKYYKSTLTIFLSVCLPKTFITRFLFGILQLTLWAGGKDSDLCYVICVPVLLLLYLYLHCTDPAAENQHGWADTDSAVHESPWVLTPGLLMV